MSFRKRNIGISDGRQPLNSPSQAHAQTVRIPGVRSSPIDGKPVTSTGVAAFDGLFAGHGGQPLGTSVIIGESGTTDYAGALLRFYVAEGLMQDHHVHVVGLPETWARELPGLASESSRKPEVQQNEKMKIAWRYESLGQQSTEAARDRALSAHTPLTDSTSPTIFCHSFDLSKRLTHPPTARLAFLQPESHPARNCFGGMIGQLRSKLKSSPPETVHRVIVPSLMSPALYPSHSCLPEQVLTFQQDLRGLSAAYPRNLVVLQTMPLSLYPRTSGLTRWIELLTDGVYELTPFPHSADAEFQTSRDPTTKEEPPQGLLQIHKLPLLHELGSGTLPSDMDWTFTLSRRKFTIKPFNLPPIEGDTKAQEQAGVDAKKAGAKDVAF